MRRLVLAGLLCGALLVPASAQGAFHLMRITEVRPGAADEDFVELQMYAAGQNLISGHYLTVYGGNGDLDATVNFMANVPNGQDQRTVLVGEPGAAGSPDVTAGLNVSAAGGAACYLDTFPLGGIDCVSWGNFTTFGGGAPSPVGANAPAIPAGQSIVRKIAAGSCPTALDSIDDTNQSGTDFVLQTTPTPRNNSVTPTETPCVPPAGPVKKKKCKKRKKKKKKKCRKKKR